MNNHPETTGKKLTSNAICERFGITRRTLARWMVDPRMGFPKSLVLNHRHYFEEIEVISWERTRAASNNRKAA